MFTTNLPVARAAFFDRTSEVQRLSEAVERLRAGAPRWLCIIGPRKIGKTSLVSESAARHRAPDLAFVMLDSFEEQPLSLEVFRTFAYRVLDAVLGA